MATRKEKVEQYLNSLSKGRRERLLKRFPNLFDLLDEQEKKLLDEKEKKQQKEERTIEKDQAKKTGIKAPTLGSRDKRIQEIVKAIEDNLVKAQEAVTKDLPGRYDIIEKDGMYFQNNSETPLTDDNFDTLMQSNALTQITPQEFELYQQSNNQVENTIRQRLIDLRTAQAQQGQKRDIATNVANQEFAAAIRDRELGQFERQEREFSKDFPESPNIERPVQKSIPTPTEIKSPVTVKNETPKQKFARVKLNTMPSSFAEVSSSYVAPSDEQNRVAQQLTLKEMQRRIKNQIGNRQRVKRN